MGVPHPRTIRHLIGSMKNTKPEPPGFEVTCAWCNHTDRYVFAPTKVTLCKACGQDPTGKP